MGGANRFRQPARGRIRLLHGRHHHRSGNLTSYLYMFAGGRR